MQDTRPADPWVRVRAEDLINLRASPASDAAGISWW